MPRTAECQIWTLLEGGDTDHRENIYRDFSLNHVGRKCPVEFQTVQ